MANRIFQTEYAKGLLTPPGPRSHGDVHVSKVTHVFATTTDENDIVEMNVLPAFCGIVDAVIVPEGTLTGRSATIGLMSGEVGSTDLARTSGSELFSAMALDGGVKRMTAASGFLIPAVGYDRSIGLKLDDELAGASTKKVTLLLFYAQ